MNNNPGVDYSTQVAVNGILYLHIYTKKFRQGSNLTFLQNTWYYTTLPKENMSYI